MSFGRGKGGKGLGRYQPTKEEMEEEAQMQLNEDIMKYTGLTLKEYQQVKGVKGKVVVKKWEEGFTGQMDISEEKQIPRVGDVFQYDFMSTWGFGRKPEALEVKDKVHRIKSFQRRIGETDLPSSAKTRLEYHYIWLAHHALISENDSKEYEQKMDALKLMIEKHFETSKKFYIPRLMSNEFDGRIMGPSQFKRAFGL